jgi:hypothetical protein
MARQASQKAPASGPAALSDLRPDPDNRRRHPDRNVEMITASLRSVGPARSIVIDEDNTVLAGNGVVSAAPGAGISKLQIIDVDGDTLVAIRRTGLSPAQKRELALFDNRTSDLSEWDDTALAADAAAGLDMRPFWTPAEEAALASRGAAADVLEMAAAGDTAAAPAGDGKAGDYQTFACPLTVGQEQVVRAALRAARNAYEVTTTGAALTLALTAWMEMHRARHAENP